jgi:DNA-binding transcriptional LysR family regulator
MDLRQLRYFQAVAHARSLSSAAERLGMAQPPLGRQIRALEEALGVTLVLRSQRGVTLTEVGRNFLARTDDLLRRMDEAIEEVREIAKGGKGQLSIGLIDEALAGHIAQKVTAFASSNRDIGVITTTDSSASLATQVNDQTLDAAVIFGPPPAHLLDITFRVIDRAPLGALVSAHHPAVAAGYVHLADLGDETFVMGRFNPMSGYYVQFTQLMRRFGIKPKMLSGIDPNMMIMEFVAAGRGISLMTLDAHPQLRPDLHLLPLSEPEASFERLLVWRPDNTNRSLRRFLDSFGPKLKGLAAG